MVRAGLEEARPAGPGEKDENFLGGRRCSEQRARPGQRFRGQTLGPEPGDIHLLCLGQSGLWARPRVSWGPALAPGIFLGRQQPGPSAGGAGRVSGSPWELSPPRLGQRLPHQSRCGCWRRASGPWRARGGCSPASPWHRASARASPGNRTDSAGRTLSGPCAATSRPVTTVGSRPPGPGPTPTICSPP